MRLLPAYRQASRGEIRKLRSGTGGRRWKGDSKMALSSSESTSWNRSGGGPLSLTGTYTVCAPRKTSRVISGVGAVGGK